MTIRDYGRFMLNPLQAEAFASMQAGLDVAITGPGGTGKSTALMRYLYDLARNIEPKQDAAMAETPSATRHKTVLHLASLRPQAGLDCTWSNFNDMHTLYAARDKAQKAGHKVVLAIDEYSLMPPAELYRCAGYDQIIATGDPAQDSLSQTPRVFADFIKARGGRLYLADQIWRSSHLPTTCMLDYYAYDHHFTTTPNNDSTMPDVYRMNLIGANKTETALRIAARIIRSHVLNYGFSYQIAISDEEIIAMVTDIVSRSKFLPDYKFIKNFIHPAAIQGLETDVILLYCPDLDAAFKTPRSIAKMATTLFGRCRHRLEFMVAPTPSSEQPFNFTTFIKIILAFSIEAAVNHESEHLKALRTKMQNLDADLIPIDHGIAIHNRRNNALMHVRRQIDERQINQHIMDLVLSEQNAHRLGWSDPAKPSLLYELMNTDLPSIQALKK